MCGKSCQADTGAVRALIMLPGRLTDRQGGCKASGDAGLKQNKSLPPHNYSLISWTSTEMKSLSYECEWDSLVELQDAQPAALL